MGIDIDLELALQIVEQEWKRHTGVAGVVIYMCNTYVIVDINEMHTRGRIKLSMEDFKQIVKGEKEWKS